MPETENWLHRPRAVRSVLIAENVTERRLKNTFYLFFPLPVARQVNIISWSARFDNAHCIVGCISVCSACVLKCAYTSCGPTRGQCRSRCDRIGCRDGVRRKSDPGRCRCRCRSREWPPTAHRFVRAHALPLPTDRCVGDGRNHVARRLVETWPAKSVDHFFAHFEGVGADARTDYCTEVARIRPQGAHSFDGVGKDVPHHAAPTGVSGTDDVILRIVEQHRYAIGGGYADTHARQCGD